MGVGGGLRCSALGTRAVSSSFTVQRLQVFLVLNDSNMCSTLVIDFKSLVASTLLAYLHHANSVLRAHFFFF